MQTILVTNYHPDGFAFALTEAGEQIFIPPYARDGVELERGKRYQAVLDREPQGAPARAHALYGCQRLD